MSWRFRVDSVDSWFIDNLEGGREGCLGYGLSRPCGDLAEAVK